MRGHGVGRKLKLLIIFMEQNKKLPKKMKLPAILKEASALTKKQKISLQTMLKELDVVRRNS